MKLDDQLQQTPFLPFIRMGDYAVRTPWYAPERRLLDYLLVYFQEGRCLFHIDGQDYHFYPGDFCLVQPGSLKTMYGLTATVTPYIHLDIFYHPLREQSFMTRMGQVDLTPYMHLMQPKLNDMEELDIPIRLQLKDPDSFAADMLKMIACWKTGNPLAQMEAQALASQLVVRMIQSHSPFEPRLSEENVSFNWLPSYLTLHLAEAITIEDMAKRANLSVSRFNVIFKQTFGVSPHQYLMKLRIDYACKLLTSTEYTIEKIGEYCGFANIHHFSKTFKQRCGIPPRAYRNAQRQCEEQN
ncbi:AraC family transcriptional regulator [Paenibacillaceae bacterium]|nr:AraC family transcriptional regulator [Paenibacillaceae bacterium]